MIWIKNTGPADIIKFSRIIVLIFDNVIIESFYKSLSFSGHSLRLGSSINLFGDTGCLIHINGQMTRSFRQFPLSCLPFFTVIIGFLIIRCYSKAYGENDYECNKQIK